METDEVSDYLLGGSGEMVTVTGRQSSMRLSESAAM